MVGIDFSVNSPAACILLNGEYHYVCYRQAAKHVVTNSNVQMLEYPVCSNILEKYDQVAEGLIRGIQNILPEPCKVAIEDYAYSGYRASQSAESCGILKYKLYKLGYQVVPYNIASIKKNATGSGKADKRAMLNAFNSSVGNIYSWFSTTDKSAKVINPICDCVDAYYVLQYGLKG